MKRLRLVDYFVCILRYIYIYKENWQETEQQKEYKQDQEEV